MSSVAKINPVYRLQFEKAQDCHVLLYPEGMVKLSESAAEILLLVDGINNQQEIVAKLREKFPDAPDDIEHDIDEFMQHATEKKWITYE